MRLPPAHAITPLAAATLPARERWAPGHSRYPLGKGHVVAYNLNPTHRDPNRSGCRLPGNAIRDWQAPVRQPNTLNEGSRP